MGVCDRNVSHCHQPLWWRIRRDIDRLHVRARVPAEASASVCVTRFRLRSHATAKCAGSTGASYFLKINSPLVGLEGQGCAGDGVGDGGAIRYDMQIRLDSSH